MRRIPLLAASTLLLNVLACHHGSPRTATVDAGFFSQVDYYPRQRQLMIHFTDGSEYGYENVPEMVYQEIIRSQNPGASFNELVRGVYHSEMLHIRTKEYALPSLPVERSEEAKTFSCSESSAERIAIKSVVLDFAAYDADDRCMILYFDKGDIYEYGNVPPQKFNALIHAPHPSKFFNHDIWGKYPTRRAQKP